MDIDVRPSDEVVRARLKAAAELIPTIESGLANPYSESLFRTLKYCPQWPSDGFASLEAARVRIPTHGDRSITFMPITQ